MNTDQQERIRRAQERALRAARAVTLTLGAALAGCSSVVSGAVADGATAEAVDAPADVPADVAVVAVDTAVDAGEDVAADAGEDVAADVETCSTEGDAALTWAECCARLNWDWNRGCGAWGPFMPPSMEG